MQFEPREGGMGPEAINVRERSATRHPSNERIEAVTQTRPLRPPPQPTTQRSATTGESKPPRVAREHANTDGPRSHKEAVQDWESEGGALLNFPAPTQRLRPPERKSRKGVTRPMSNLIAKIRQWLHIEKKPKT